MKYVFHISGAVSGAIVSEWRMPTQAAVTTATKASLRVEVVVPVPVPVPVPVAASASASIAVSFDLSAAWYRRR